MNKPNTFKLSVGPTTRIWAAVCEIYDADPNQEIWPNYVKQWQGKDVRNSGQEAAFLRWLEHKGMLARKSPEGMTVNVVYKFVKMIEPKVALSCLKKSPRKQQFLDPASMKRPKYSLPAKVATPSPNEEKGIRVVFIVKTYADVDDIEEYIGHKATKVEDNR